MFLTLKGNKFVCSFIVINYRTGTKVKHLVFEDSKKYIEIDLLELQNVKSMAI